MKIGIIGGGSIGLLVARYLCEYHDITIYVRRHIQKQRLLDHGLFLANQKNSCHVTAKLSTALAETKEDCIIVCVKQPELATILPMLSQINDKTPIIFLQNGMGHIDLLGDLTQPTYIGIVTHGALRKSDHIVAHTGKGMIRLAGYSGQRHQLTELIQSLDNEKFPFHEADNWYKILSEKLVINAVINPLTAIFAVPNGDIIRNKHLTMLAKELCQEACSVLQLDYMEQWNHVRTVATNTKENVSSMWKDLKEYKKTENEAISGFLMKKTTKSIPYTAFVYHSMKALEVKKGISE